VARFRLCLATGLALTALIASVLYGQVGDEDSPNDTPQRPSHHASPSAKPRPSPKKKKSSPTPTKTSSKSKSNDEEDSTPKPKGSAAKKKQSSDADDEDQKTPAKGSAKASPKPSKTPSPGSKQKKKKSGSGSKPAKGESPARKARETEPAKTPKPSPPASKADDGAASATPRAVAVPKPADHPTPGPPASSPADTAAQLTIEKSGFEESSGLQPTPSPPPRRIWFWPWSRPRSDSRRYTYLTRSVIEEIRRAPVASNRWKFIVVHNSGTRQGNAKVFDYYHRHVRRMQNGLAYHFVIGNGTSTGNGEIEVGDRWRRQINGGHVHSDYLNNIALGICLVGDFNRDQPTRAQLDACEELIRYLRERCGKADGRPIPVRPHREVNPPRWATDCPGDDFPYSWFRKF
jgi:N-acetylmuramoyl-L-alanine amidase-like protein